VAKRKYTRKQLRKPDEFISFWSRVVEVARENASRVIVTIVVAILIVAGVWTWSYFSDARAARATADFTKAFEIYNQAIFPMEAKLPPTEDGIPRFKTQKAKLAAAEKEFTAAMKTAGSSLAPVAQLMRAGTRYELGKYDEAIADYKAYLAKGDVEQLRYSANEGIGYCYEASKQWDKALQAFRKLPRDGERKWLALYHEGRVLAAKGQKEDAVKVLKEVVEKAKSSAVQNRAGEQLALIEKGK
jgi:tetratricopeptide (TPR) repeat protein